MNREIIININEANKAQKYQKKEELFQIEAFERVSKILNEHKIDDNKTKDITDCRFHDTIFIDGDRGVGKTAFMINIENYYNTHFEQTSDNNKLKYIFLKSVDPTLLEHTEKFLSVILARIVEYVNDKKKYIDKDFEEKYYKSLQNLSKSLESIKTLDNDIGIEEIASNKSSLKLEQYSHEFFKIVSKMFNVNAIVMLIDDVDMAFDKGFDVLEVVRKYLASPYLIPIVAGDMKLYREIVETQFMDKIDFQKDVETLGTTYSLFDKNIKESYLSKKNLVDNLIEQYLNKIFPSEYHVKLYDIYSIFKLNNVLVKFNDEIIIPFVEIKDFEKSHINLGINQESFIFRIFVNNTRKLIQYLNAKKSIYINFFANTEYDYTKSTRYEKFNTKNILNKYHYDLLKFINSPEYRKSLEITYKISEFSEKKELINLLKANIESYTNKKYDLHNILNHNNFKNQKFYIEEINDKYVVQYRNLDEVKKIDSKYSDIENYIINLFIHNDYISSNYHQTRNYLFTGKFIEMIISTFSIQKEIIIKKEILNNVYETIKIIDFDYILDYQDYLVYSLIFDKDSKDLDDEELNNFLKYAKSGSKINIDTIKEISEYFDNETFDYQKNLQILEEIVNKTPFNSKITINEENDDYEDEIYIESRVEELSRQLILWKNIFYKELNINALSLYRILYKFFENLSILKARNIRNVKDSPLEFFQRVVIIFINSIAFFENTNINVANTNIAIGDKFDLKIALTKTNAATLNIKPLISEKMSLTKALFFHPIISHILFPHEDSKLYSLKFVSSSNEYKTILESKHNENLENIFSKYFINVKKVKEDLGMNHIDIYKKYFNEIKSVIDIDSKKILRNGNMKFAKLYKHIKEKVSDKDSELETLMKKYQELISK